ncbi:AI-2E family transporter [bacterium]|nr:AI-2E family transporter [bacterium]
MTKKILMFGLAIMITLLALLILWQFRQVLVYVLISITIAATIRPLLSHLRRKKVLARISWILIYLVAISGFGLLLFFSTKAVVTEVQLLANTVSVQDKWQLPYWLQGTAFENLLIPRLPLPSLLFEAFTGEQGQLVLPTIMGFTQDLATIFSAGFIILFLSIYWIINQINFERLWLSLLPSEQRKRARDIWRTIEMDLGAYIRSQIVYSLLAGLLFGLGYWILGSPYPVLLAVTGALACLIPVVGVALAVIPPILIGMLTDVQLSMFSMLYTIIVLVGLGIWVRPRLFNRKWDNPILTLILLMIMANAFGIPGIILAPPLSAILQILWFTLVSHRHESGASAQISDLKERQERINKTILALGGTPPALVTSSMERLNLLLEKAEPVLNAALDATEKPAD